MRTKVNLSDLESNQEKPDISKGGIIPSKPFFLKEDEVIKEEGIITLKDGTKTKGETIVEQKFSIKENYTPENYEATNLTRDGLVVISQLRREFENTDFSTKFADDLKAFKIEFPGTTKNDFIEDETTRLNKIKEYIQQCLPDNYSDFQEYQIVNSYLHFIQTPDQNQEPKQAEIKAFIDYLQIGDKVKLMTMLHELLDNAKTKDFARIIIALKELNYIHIPSPRNLLFKAMRDRFKNIGADSGMNSYFADNGAEKLKIHQSEIEETKQLIEKRLKG